MSADAEGAASGMTFAGFDPLDADHLGAVTVGENEPGRLTTGRLDPEAPYHTFLFTTSDSGNTGRPYAVARLREWLDDVPETKAAFILRYFTDSHSEKVTDLNDIKEVKAGWFCDEMMWLVDAWKVPPYYPHRSQAQSWVNPHYIHPGEYADGAVECRCGHLVSSTDGEPDESSDHIDNAHADDCRTEWAFETAAKVYSNRRAILCRQALLGKSAGHTTERLGIDTGRACQMARSIGPSYSEVRKRGRKKRANTIAKLLWEGHSTSEAATVYGISESFTRETVSDMTPYSVGQIKDALDDDETPVPGGGNQ